VYRSYQLAALLVFLTAANQGLAEPSKAEAGLAQANQSVRDTSTHHAKSPPDSPTPPAQSSKTVQIVFNRPEGMTITWGLVAGGHSDSAPLAVPGRYNFPEAAMYHLKLATIPGRPSVEFYPTLEIRPFQPRTERFLNYNAVPVSFTDEDFDHVLSGGFVTKVIYLPDPAFQELPGCVETLVSTRLDPDVDPIVEAERRGAILAIARLDPRAVVTAANQAEPSATSTLGPWRFARRHCWRLGGRHCFRR
jgi:hypothetical protein